MPDESENSVSAPVCGVAQLGRPRVVAVVVTYNRQDLLPITLAGIAAGQVVPDVVVVVDNASTDSTAEYLKNLSTIQILCGLWMMTLNQPKTPCMSLFKHGNHIRRTAAVVPP